jgi:hypothetical protein
MTPSKPRANLCQLNENKICDHCHECRYCDLNPKKICDNCCECLDNFGHPASDYAVIEIAGIIMDVDEMDVPIPRKKKSARSDK